MTTSVTVQLAPMTCGSCGVAFGIGRHHYDQLIANNGAFTCPNGCRRRFTGETDAQKIAALQRQLYEERDQKYAESKRADTANKKLRNLKRRVSGGVCPFCPRTFKDLQRHIANQHEEHTKDQALKVRKKETFKKSGRPTK